MTEVEVTVRMPREVFDGAVKWWRDQCFEAERERADAGRVVTPTNAAYHFFRAAMLEHTPPWEPTEEQVTAFIEKFGWVGHDGDCSDARVFLIAAHAVLCEGGR